MRTEDNAQHEHSTNERLTKWGCKYARSHKRGTISTTPGHLWRPALPVSGELGLGNGVSRHNSKGRRQLEGILSQSTPDDGGNCDKGCQQKARKGAQSKGECA